VEAKTIRRGLVAAAALAVAALVLPPFINVSRYKSRVTQSMSNALGRAVTCDSIELHLLPQPGFYLQDVAIADDPAYSAEPILHAEEVHAYLSLSSLWRGRLEIARLNLNYPSLNLVERPDASWNLESLLWKTSRTDTAPTAAPLSNSRPRFPYIEASNGRINFKYGLEKSVFSFTEADFTLWSPAENQWRMRLEARPVRTDMPITDTGTVKADVTMQRAGLLRDSPVKATVTWERVQLGNLTRLVHGEDGLWRGALETSAQFSGTPAALHFSTASRLRDFRRFDISTSDASVLNATCQGEMNISANLIQNAECHLPLDAGLISVRGTLRGLHHPRYDLTLAAENIGADALIRLARRAKSNLPDDLTASGTLSASFHADRATEAPANWIGALALSPLVIHSAVLGKDLAIGRTVAVANTTEAPAIPRHGHPASEPPHLRALVLRSFDLPLGAANPVTAEGTIDDQLFALHLKGDATLERLQQFARTVGIGAPKIACEGPAAIDLVISGNWRAFSPPQVTGSAQLKDASAKVPGLALPLQIASARVELDRDRFSLRNASATVGKVSLAGSATFPRFCDGESPCESTFELTTDELNPERWNEVLNPRLTKKPWYRLFGVAEAEPNVIANLHASGHLSARRLTLETTTASSFETAFSIKNGLLELKDARAEIFGGSISGHWQIDFTGAQPQYESTGTANQIQAEKLTPLLKASLGSGTLGVEYKLKMAGWDAAALASSSEAETAFTWHGGALRLSPDTRTPLRVHAGHGTAALGKDGWTISASQWITPTGIYQLSGTVSRDSDLALEFAQGSNALWKVSGTLAKPQLAAPAPKLVQARRR
jgi:hypothetical protein